MGRPMTAHTAVFVGGCEPHLTQFLHSSRSRRKHSSPSKRVLETLCTLRNRHGRVLAKPSGHRDCRFCYRRRASFPARSRRCRFSRSLFALEECRHVAHLRGIVRRGFQSLSTFPATRGRSVPGSEKYLSSRMPLMSCTLSTPLMHWASVSSGIEPGTNLPALRGRRIQNPSSMSTSGQTASCSSYARPMYSSRWSKRGSRRRQSH